MGKTGGGAGTNQYQTKGRAQQSSRSGIPTIPASHSVAARLRSDILAGRYGQIGDHISSPETPDKVLRVWANALSGSPALPTNDGKMGGKWYRAVRALHFVAKAVADHPNCSPSTLDQLLDARHPVVKQAAFGSPQLSDEQWESVSAQALQFDTWKDVDPLRCILGNPRMHDEQYALQWLAQHPKASSTMLTLGHCPEALAQQVLSDPTDEDGWIAIAGNPSCSVDRLHILATSVHRRVYRLVIGHPHCDEQALRSIAQHGYKVGEVRGTNEFRILDHPLCPVDVVVQYVGDPDPNVRRKALAHPLCPNHIRAIGTLALPE